MRHGWIVGLGCLLLTTPLHAGPTTASPPATPQAADANQPAAKAASTDARATKATKANPYQSTQNAPKVMSVAKVSVGDVGILMGIKTTELVQAAGLWPVHEYDDTHPNAPKKVSLIRSANHRIEGTEVRRTRAVGDVDGSVFVLYTTRNGQGGRDPHIRKILPDNTLGFDVTVLMESKAGIAPDGAGGVYVVTHKTFASDGEFYHDQTAHNSLRINSAGAIVWQVAEPGAPMPSGDPQYWSAAARSSQGVFVGYGYKTGADQATPVLLHRKSGDGSKLYKRAGLKAPAAGAAGVVGTTPLLGIVDRIWPAPDGSVVARVYRQTADQLFVRVDASGTQTAAFKCPGTNPQLLPHNNGGVICVHMPSDGKIHVVHYGVSGGNLKNLGAWTSAPISGWTFSQIAVTVDGQYLATASTTSGFAGLALFSASGVLLDKTLATARPGAITRLIVGGHDWLAMHKGGDIDPRPAVFRGAFAPGAL